MGFIKLLIIVFAILLSLTTLFFALREWYRTDSLRLYGGATKGSTIIYIALISLCIIHLIYRNDIDKCYTKHENFEGRIARKYLLDRPNTGVIVVQSEKVQEYKECTIFNIDTFKIIESGDYIIKKRGDLFYMLIKNKDTMIFRN